METPPPLPPSPYPSDFENSFAANSQKCPRPPNDDDSDSISEHPSDALTLEDLNDPTYVPEDPYDDPYFYPAPPCNPDSADDDDYDPFGEYCRHSRFDPELTTSDTDNEEGGGDIDNDDRW